MNDDWYRKEKQRIQGNHVCGSFGVRGNCVACSLIEMTESTKELFQIRTPITVFDPSKIAIIEDVKIVGYKRGGY